jgi:ribonuclease D
VQYQIVSTDRDLAELCRQLATAEAVAFDTEFVSEHTYRPQLCLIQVSLGEQLFVIDPLEIDDVRPFWETLASPGHETIVHAGRQELVFCLEATGRPLAALFDVQLAAGMIGLEYPAGYGTLISKLLGERPQKGETRTDWRRRPLSERQLEYALDDVRHLPRLRATLGQRLERLDRVGWFQDEMANWLRDVENSRQSERWRKVTGSSSLSGRSLAIVRALWNWREREAERRNSPVRQVLRDDLIVELAKRRSADPKQIAALRGMERGDLRRAAPDLARIIEQALLEEEHRYPETIRTDSNPQLTMLGQFLSSALSSICREAQVAPSLVGTASDVRDLIAYRLNGDDSNSREMPVLAQGWRAAVVGQLLDDLLTGKVSIRIKNPASEQPLVFERGGAV